MLSGVSQSRQGRTLLGERGQEYITSYLAIARKNPGAGVQESRRSPGHDLVIALADEALRRSK